MEVKNQTMDQMLVNAVAQAPANQNARAAKDAEQNKFGSMVHQKRTESEKAAAKPQKAEAQKPAEDTTEKPTDEQYAIAAAMMYQVMQDPRLAAVQADSAEIQAEPAELQLLEEIVPDEAELPAELLQESAMPVEAEPTAPDLPQTAIMAVQPEAQEARSAAEATRIVTAEASGELSDEEEETGAQAAQEAPLFEHVEAPVVKVAEAPRPVPLEAEDGVERLGSELDMMINSADANRVEITLTPENLGRLTVEITRGTDGTLNVVLHATTERAANLLEKGMDGLRQALGQSATRTVEVEVRGGEEPQQQFLNPDGQQNERHQQQRQQRNRRQDGQANAQDFLQQLRLGLVDVDSND